MIALLSHLSGLYLMKVIEVTFHLVMLTLLGKLRKLKLLLINVSQKRVSV